jgi:hypothetical protein
MSVRFFVLIFGEVVVVRGEIEKAREYTNDTLPVDFMCQMCQAASDAMSDRQFRGKMQQSFILAGSSRSVSGKADHIAVAKC